MFDERMRRAADAFKRLARGGARSQPTPSPFRPLYPPDHDRTIQPNPPTTTTNPPQGEDHPAQPAGS